jgi:hypothetical protein
MDGIKRPRDAKVTSRDRVPESGNRRSTHVCKVLSRYLDDCAMPRLVLATKKRRLSAISPASPRLPGPDMG